MVVQVVVTVRDENVENPGADVATILAARKLGDQQGSIRVGKIGFGPRPTQRTAGDQKSGDPLAKSGFFVGMWCFECERGSLKFAQRRDRRSRQMKVVVQKRRGDVASKTQRAHSAAVVYAEGNPIS